jgi:hypothetical protein
MSDSSQIIWITKSNSGLKIDTPAYNSKDWWTKANQEVKKRSMQRALEQQFGQVPKPRLLQIADIYKSRYEKFSLVITDNQRTQRVLNAQRAIGKQLKKLDDIKRKHDKALAEARHAAAQAEMFRFVSMVSAVGIAAAAAQTQSGPSATKPSSSVSEAATGQNCVAHRLSRR